MSEHDKQPKRLVAALEDHGAEGISILTSEPRPMIIAMIYLIVTMLAAGFVWSFIGRADVIVTAQGSLTPESDVRRVYAPVEGELVDIYMAEGMPVSQGDVLARINSTTAIEAATRSLDAQNKLINALEKYKLFPAEKKAMKRKVEALKVQLDAEQRAHERRMQESIARFSEQQRLKLEKSQALVEKARKDMELAKSAWQKLERLYRSPGRGGISKQRLDQAKTEYETKKLDLELAIGSLKEFENQLSNELLSKREELQKKSEELERLYIQYEQESLKLKEAQSRAEMEVKLARIAAEGAARVSFEDIDEENFLRVKAPVSGVLTSVAYTQVGDKIESKSPLAGIAPEDARMVLKINIPEQDRGFLREGMAVKLKFNAFPYQRYGFIEGTLEYISPSATADQQTKKLVYKGRVSLERDYIEAENKRFPLRFGMTASAEIVVRQRRMIDMALDTLRGTS